MTGQCNFSFNMRIGKKTHIWRSRESFVPADSLIIFKNSSGRNLQRNLLSKATVRNIENFDHSISDFQFPCSVTQISGDQVERTRRVTYEL